LADSLLTSFCLAIQEQEKTVGRGEPEHPTSARLAIAEEFLRASLDKPVSHAGLAAAAGVSIRTISRGFVERHGTGPMGFLRRPRMEAVYRDLLGATQDATSVTKTAMRYGFDHLGRFAANYRRAFHESPSDTLRH
jgi:transcriptional regulator GlxA family with amidase domain